METNLANGEQKHHHMVHDPCDTGVWPARWSLWFCLLLLVGQQLTEQGPGGAQCFPPFFFFPHRWADSCGTFPDIPTVSQWEPLHALHWEEGQVVKTAQQCQSPGGENITGHKLLKLWFHLITSLLFTWIQTASSCNYFNRIPLITH